MSTDKNLPWSGDWCEGAPVEMADVGRHGTCTGCDRLIIPKKDGTARKHRPFR